MRRSDLEVRNIEEIIDIIDRCKILHLGISDIPAPYVVPVNFGYTSGGGKITFYFHSTVQKSRKAALILKNPYISFEAACAVTPVQGDEACRWTTSYACVMGEGTVELITSEDEKIEAMNCIMFCNGFKGNPVYNEATLKKTALYKINVEKVSAKVKPIPNA